MPLIKPKALKAGDTLGIVACSTPISNSANETIERAFSRLRDYGFNIVEAPNCRKTYGHAAGTIRERADALNGLFRNKKINGILSYWGGNQSHQLLEYLDFDAIKKNPKPLIGYSDTTSLLTGIHQQTGLVTFSGPAGITFGKPTLPEFSWKHFEQVLMHTDTPLSIPVSEEYSDNFWFSEPDQKMKFEKNTGWTIYRKGVAAGPIIGGNIGTMLLLAGTKYWPKMKGRILFLEEDESESTRSIDRMFTQLRHMGIYDQIAGMVIGRFNRCLKFSDSDSLKMILDDALKGYRFPVITGVDYGHTDPLITVPMGIRCRVDTREPEIVFLDSAVL
jgi:muramoyltetrapeptide carboxypeptidase